MILEKIIQGFSKLSREEKIQVAAEFAGLPDEFANELFSHWHPELQYQDRYAEFTENAVSNFYLPYSLAPNFRINGKDYIVPMVTDESSVVAAAAAAAKFWWPRGGFETNVRKTTKVGHIHFLWKGSNSVIEAFIGEIMAGLYESARSIEQSMRERGGGIERITLVNLTDRMAGYFQVKALFNTVDAMGANFINTCLEAMAEHMIQQAEIEGIAGNLEIIMAVLSNYTPQCLVECKVACSVHDLEQSHAGMSGENFVRRFETAVLMARHDISRAVTHNKGIFNGIDAVVLATGNDFRAVEAAGHAWAAKDGVYKGLSQTTVQGHQFVFSFELPLAVGVIGGLTNLHPLAMASLQLLGNPSAGILMSVVASAGMANHFSAIRALITGGIQQGHMKMHLSNLLNQLNASQGEKELAMDFFRKRKVSYADVREFLSAQRTLK